MGAVWGIAGKELLVVQDRRLLTSRWALGGGEKIRSGCRLGNRFKGALGGIRREVANLGWVLGGGEKIRIGCCLGSCIG